MRIWIENPYDNLPDEGYRPLRYWLMAEAFAAAGCETTLFTADFSHANKAKRKFVRRCERDFALEFVHEPPYPANVCIKRIFSHRAYAANWLARARELAAAKGAPDVIIVSMPPLSTVRPALRLGRESGAMLVFDVMDAWPETFYRLVPRAFGAFARPLLSGMHRTARLAYRSADLVTGVCDRYGEMVREYGAKEYRRFYHGIASGRETHPREKADSIRLVYAGNLGRGYDLGTVIAAVKRIEDATLDIAGSGELEWKWRELANGDGRIRFHGYVGADELGTLLDSATIGVIPLRDDSFVGLPYKIGDYAQHLLKIVSSLGGECAAMLSRYSIGSIYRPGDVESLVSAIKSINVLKPDFPGLLDELDSGRIYSEYAKCVIERCRAMKA